MTNYIRDLSSTVIAFRRDAERAALSCQNDANYTDGVMTWKSNGNVPFSEMIELASYLGLPVDVAKSNAARDAQTTKFLAEYRKTRRNGPSAEERAEARAAHGEGVVLVDLITGYEWKT